ncbi:MAG: bifunctional folylpolyglutamate synthase/dihydrofolate synthase [Actinomycetia bacterium]|nr:bifunctional folylpolyglutamate synthase/dihydrofolate synthase [Actinomycetes bacterium]
MDNYQKSLAVLKGTLQFGIEASLEGTIALMHFMGDPQDRYPCIQVAGTNGKTSTARFCQALLKASGYHTGLFTSPELIEYPERMEIDGKVISHERFAEVVLYAWDVAEQAIAAGRIAAITEFELLCAAAFHLFAVEQLDYAVFEVGMGGRWDATSVVRPQVAVVTGIGLDHIGILGNTVEQIAAEKAAIIKPGSFAVLGPGTAETRQVFLERIAEVGADHLVVEPPYEHFEFAGPSYQQANIASARSAVEQLLGQKLPHQLVQQAVGDLVIPGRFEILRTDPLLMIDASHNPQSAEYLHAALLERFRLQPDEQGCQRLDGLDALLLCILADKDADGIITALTPLFKRLAVTRSASARALPPEVLAAKITRLDGRQPEVYASVPEALATLRGTATSTLATGSITLAGEAKAYVAGQ